MGYQICHSSVHKTHALYNDMSECRVYVRKGVSQAEYNIPQDRGCRMGATFVSDGWLTGVRCVSDGWLMGVRSLVR